MKTIMLKTMVDESIAPLIYALDSLPCVLIMDNCGGTLPAYINFKFQGAKRSELFFFDHLGKAIKQEDDGVNCIFLLMWTKNGLVGRLEFYPKSIDKVTRIIISAVNSRRIRQFLRGGK